MTPAHEDNLIWIDLEMTGLDTDNDSILEIATIVTDKDLNVLAEGPVFAISHSDARLQQMDAWNRNQHQFKRLARASMDNCSIHAARAYPKFILPAALAPMIINPYFE